MTDDQLKQHWKRCIEMLFPERLESFRREKYKQLGLEDILKKVEEKKRKKRRV